MFSIFWPFNLIGGLLRLLVSFLVLASCALTVAAFMGERGWLWSLFSHFRVQYFAIQFIALILITLSWWLIRRKGKPLVSRAEVWMGTIFLMFFAGLNLSQIAPYYPPFAKPDARESESADTVKLMHINLFGYLNNSRSLVIEALQTTDADMVDLVEYTEPWRRELERSGVLKRYPYKFTGKNHIGLYSKRPLRNARLVYTNPRQQTTPYANIIADFKLNGHPVTILVAHPASPIQPSHLQWQQASFRAWARERGKLGRNLIIVGDLNTAPWSPEFAQLLSKTGLRDSQMGFGIQPTWPAFFPVPGRPHAQSSWAAVLGIPIDHVLVSERILVFSRRTGPFVGSDHWPVVAELGLKKI
jgi:endonuclease/exonuclease/phosphatase (EEP) superfamily protein YafD